MFAAMGDLRSITVDDAWTLKLGDLDVWERGFRQWSELYTRERVAKLRSAAE